MKIAQLAPLWETVPPRSYGGTELVVSLLTDDLVRRGHQVTLFAAGGSASAARLFTATKRPLRDLYLDYPEACGEQISLYPGSPVSAFFELQALETFFSQAHQFDIIHNHLGPLVLPFARLAGVPVITTLHGAINTKTLYHQVEKSFYCHYADLPFVSISNSQRRCCSELNYIGTVYHGLDLSKYDYSIEARGKDYLAFLGRFCEDKGAHLAVEAALRTGSRLVMAGKVDTPEEKDYFETRVAPHVDGQQICFIGELNHTQKVELLKNAKATLCPIQWPEPFGLVLVESLACGTPVITMPYGSVPELIENNRTGFVVESVDEMGARIAQIPNINRLTCRQQAEVRFTHELMTSHYLSLYEQIITDTHGTEHTAKLASSYASTASVLRPQAAARHH